MHILYSRYLKQCLKIITNYMQQLYILACKYLTKFNKCYLKLNKTDTYATVIYLTFSKFILHTQFSGCFFRSSRPDI
jgi:hypothetical protein